MEEVALQGWRMRGSDHEQRDRDHTVEMGIVVNSELDAAISEAVRAVSFGEVLASRGETVIAIGDGGRLIRHEPDGSTSALT